jgi:hypothetical protein
MPRLPSICIAQRRMTACTCSQSVSETCFTIGLRRCKQCTLRCCSSIFEEFTTLIGTAPIPLPCVRRHDMLTWRFRQAGT